MRVTFIGEACTAVFMTYRTGEHAIQLMCEDGEPMATATVCVPNFRAADGEVIVKCYSENAQMDAALVAAGVVEPAHQVLDLFPYPRVVTDGESARARAAVCKLTPAALQAIAAAGRRS